MHKLLVPASPALERTAVAAWIAEAVGRREKVLYKHAPTEDATAVLTRSLPEVGLDPAVLRSGQVQLADTTDPAGPRPAVATRRCSRCTATSSGRRPGRASPGWR